MPSSYGLRDPGFMMDPCTGPLMALEALGCGRLSAPLLDAGVPDDRQNVCGPAGTACQPAAFTCLCYLIPTKAGVSLGTALSRWGPRCTEGSLVSQQEGPQWHPGGAEANLLTV